MNAGRIVVELSGLFNVRGDKVTVPERAVVVSGTVQGFAPGQKVELVASVGSHVFRRLKLSIARRGRHGHFQTTLHAPRAGRVTVRLLHARDDQMLSFERWASFTTLDSEVSVGTTGRFVQLVQQKLAALHFYVPQTGVYDEGTELAVNAYHRLLGKGEGHTTLDPTTLTDLLNGIGTFHVRYPTKGPHVEGDLSDQVLALINGSTVYQLFPISSGKPSTPTILGNFQVYRKQPGYLPDGMYFSSFFTGGYAVHGYDPAPDYPASHGCMRLPIVDAIHVYDWIQMGDWVDTYYT
ncbi:MAG TPA: L,D-transpeptidase [Solirubrobacteraceae bacterium]|nr:L,D-transpeptidase [Solirubrobacteraceae bacterium]